ncbi:MAG: ABC transporter permease [Pseudochelatococcus sp.]|jgi:peptide/nickel transport system permease protein|uniref:ABC transporter permease n=1 Tax=Pseudochelatococcus sp. TaxID=2020869 RepID=UPI003D8D2A44
MTTDTGSEIAVAGTRGLPAPPPAQPLPVMEGPASAGPGPVRRLFALWSVRLSATALFIVVAMAVMAPWLGTVDPVTIDPAQRLRGMTAAHWLGTDSFGRDVYSRLAYGARVSLVVGAGAVLISVVFGMFFGVVTGYFRWADMVIMRFMDGLMAIPGILLAIALVAVSGATIATVVIAISVPEIPRVVRMVRSVILGVRSEPYVEAATILGTKLPAMVWRHLIPNTLAPLLVQGTYIFAAAIMTEAILSFLGAGVPPETPSWGNMMADARVYFLLKPELILIPGIMVSITVLSVNMLGDVLRDSLDPRMAKRL